MGSIFITNSNNTIDFNVTTMSFLYRSVVSAIPGRSHPSPQRLEMGNDRAYTYGLHNDRGVGGLHKHADSSVICDVRERISTYILGSESQEF